MDKSSHDDHVMLIYIFFLNIEGEKDFVRDTIVLVICIFLKMNGDIMSPF
jgi:hypothetical protein